jgi:hypothetical protein
MPDFLDDLINDAFTDFDAAERSAHRPVPGTGAVRHKVAVRRRARFTAFGVVGALLVAVPVTAYSASPRGNNSPPGTVVSPSPDRPSPTPTTTPPPAAEPDDVRTATLKLPAFPRFEEHCKAEGTRKFVNGKARTVGTTELTIGELTPIRADLDGRPGDELLTTLACRNDGSVHPVQLLALKVAPDGSLSPLGFVLDDSFTAGYTPDTVKVDGGVVRLEVIGDYQSDGNPPCDPQIRGYAYRDGAFRQVEGPTRFTKPPANFHDVDLRNTGLILSRDDPSGSVLYCMRMKDGAGEVSLRDDYRDEAKGRTRYMATMGPVSRFAGREDEVTFALVTLRAPNGEVSQTLQSFGQYEYPTGAEVLRSGEDGITRIEKAEVRGNRIEVTVRTAAGEQVWSYRPASMFDQRWDRLGS